MARTKPAPKKKFCKVCTKQLPVGAVGNRMYCGDACKIKAHMDKTRAKKRGSKARTTPAIKNFRELVKYGGVDDPHQFAREVLQDSIREVVTQHVQDNILGAGEALTAMLPKVMAGLAVDLESQDWMVRSRAQAAVLKYAFEFKDTKGKDDNLGSIQIFHNVNIPDTPLGQAIAEEVEGKIVEQHEIESGVEGFEQDWPTCSACHERKHPDALDATSSGSLLCSSCRVKRHLENTQADMDPIYHSNDDFEFAAKRESPNLKKPAVEGFDLDADD